MKLRYWAAAAAAAVGVLAGGGASAAIVGSWSGLDFTVIENNVADGVSGGIYTADFHLHYSAPLQFVRVTSLADPSSWFPTFPVLPGDPDPAGDLFVQMIGDPAAGLPASGALFTVTFSAPGAQVGDAISVTISNEANPPGGVVVGNYGNLSDPVGGTAGFVQVQAPGSVPAGSTVPEPSALALVGLALGGLLAARRRSA